MVGMLFVTAAKENISMKHAVRLCASGF